MRAAAPFLLLMLCACAGSTRAQDAIHRCVDARGNPLFTDQPCSSQRATPVQAPTPAASAAPPGVPMPLHRCAATAMELRRRVIAAFAIHDPNRLAGLMLWRGYGDHAAVDDLRTLARLVRQPLLEIHFDNEAAAASSAPPPADALQVRTEGGDDASFAIAHQAGCLWLRRDD